MYVTNGCIFVSISKTGSTSIRATIRQNGPTHYIGSIPHPEVGARHTLNKYQAHFTPVTLAQSFGPDIVRRFKLLTVVRNPWDRFVSWWAWGYKNGNSRPPGSDSDSGFEKYFWAQVRQEGRTLGPTFQSEFFDARYPYTYVGRTETLDRDWETLSQLLGADSPLPRLNQSRHGDYRDYYTPKMRDLVHRKETYVIERFGYEF